MDASTTRLTIALASWVGFANLIASAIHPDRIVECLLIPRLSDSLAGRMEILRLYSLCQAELERTQPLNQHSSYLRPRFSNRAKRLIKSPKLHFGDTGPACSLLRCGAAELYEQRALLEHVLPFGERLLAVP